MSYLQIQEVIEQTGISEWGAGYFSIDRTGNVICMPTGSDKFGSVSLPEVIQAANANGISTPMIIRFPQIIKQQLIRMHSAFLGAIQEFQYQGQYFGVFPFKVNQRREFIDAIVSCGMDLDWGLEVGSKTEFMAALSYPMSPKALLVCNGFKDQEFVSMAFTAATMGRNVVIVVEGPDELEMIIEQAKLCKNPDVIPSIGLRIRLYSKGSGKWENSSGETSKFGLSTIELMESLELIEKSSLQSKLTMLHFHAGSQITAIKRFKNAIREAARVYAKIVKMGFSPTQLNIGGGMGVDYDGSRTTAPSSANYSLQEFANDAVYVIGEVCKNEQVPHPNIVTESGRVIAAHHAVVVTDIREVQGEDRKNSASNFAGEVSDNVHKYITELQYVLDNMSGKNYVEFYHDAIEYHEDLFTLFNLGYLNLKERAITEELFHKICLQSLYYSSFQKHPPEEFVTLQKTKVSKYLANFSIFQSIPDSWSIDQLFPVLPLSRHQEKPSHKATIVDITCDSDGCIERFVDRREEKAVIDLHQPNGSSYYLGFFLVGAYQESLANEHNLFGAIHEVEVILNEDKQWHLAKITNGDTLIELLSCRNYSYEEMTQSYKTQVIEAVQKGEMEELEGRLILERLEKYLYAYPYLKES